MHSAIHRHEAMQLFGTFLSAPDTHGTMVKELIRECVFGKALGSKQGSTPAASNGEYRGRTCGLLQFFALLGRNPLLFITHDASTRGKFCGN